ncbi:MAG: serine hydrolase domain-containing protein [Phenylobacterium sp.]
MGGGSRPDRRGVLTGAAALAAGGWAAATLTGCSQAKSEKATMQGFSEDGLARLREGLVVHLEHGYAPGLVALVSRGAESRVIMLGAKSFDAGDPMRRDTIFRIASMTKPVTAAAAMMLIEDGRLKLDEPVDRLLPELARRRVLKRIDGPLDQTVPAARPITVEDLLTFRLGLGLVLAPPGSYPIQQRISELGLVGFGPPDPAAPDGPDDWMRKLGTLPLMAQPGERWMYNTGSDVLGVLVARASGQALEAFFRERIFAPLGMKDTGFSVAPAEIERLASAYRGGADGLVAYDTPAASKWARPPPFPAGGSGLVSTADDYLAFARMLLAGGQAGGKRLLSADSVRAMTMNHLTPAQRAGGRIVLDEGRGWGYGMAVTVEPNADLVAPGAYGWTGGLGTSWMSDPSKDLVAVLLTQRAFDTPKLPAIHADFAKAAYRALTA